MRSKLYFWGSIHQFHVTFTVVLTTDVTLQTVNPFLCFLGSETANLLIQLPLFGGAIADHMLIQFRIDNSSVTSRTWYDLISKSVFQAVKITVPYNLTASTTSTSFHLSDYLILVTPLHNTISQVIVLFKNRYFRGYSCMTLVQVLGRVCVKQ